MFGATGDLARRKLLPGLLHLSCSHLAPEIRIIGTSLDELDNDSFRELAAKAFDEFSHHKVSKELADEFIANLTFVQQQEGPEALAKAVAEQREVLGAEAGLLHYLSVPPSAVMPVMEMLHKADLVEHSRVIMEKPFGTDLASAESSTPSVHAVFDEEQIFRIDHFLGKEAAQNILAFRFANGCSSRSGTGTTSTTSRSMCPRRSDVRTAPSSTNRPVRSGTWWSPTCSRSSRSSRWNRRRRSPRRASATRRTRSSALCGLNRPRRPWAIPRYRDEPGVSAGSDTETFIALRRDRQLAMGGGALLPPHRQTARRGTHHLDRVPTASEDHVPDKLRAWTKGPAILPSTSPSPRSSRCRSTASAPVRAWRSTS